MTGVFKVSPADVRAFKRLPSSKRKSVISFYGSMYNAFKAGIEIRGTRVISKMSFEGDSLPTGLATREIDPFDYWNENPEKRRDGVYSQADYDALSPADKEGYCSFFGVKGFSGSVASS